MMKLRLNRDKALLTPVIGVFWENKNRNSIFHLIDRSQDGFKTFSYIVAIQKQAVYPFHPGAKERVI